MPTQRLLDSNRCDQPRHLGFVLGSIWGVAKFAFLFFVLYLELQNTWFASKTFTVLWLSAPHLMIPAGFLMLWLYPRRYRVYARLLSVGLVLSVASGAGTVIHRFRSILGASLEPQLFGFRTIGILLLATVIDLIFLVFLLSSKASQPDRERGRPTDKTNHAELPKWDESDIEEG
jgi:ATP/ADP translocase